MIEQAAVESGSSALRYSVLHSLLPSAWGTRRFTRNAMFVRNKQSRTGWRSYDNDPRTYSTIDLSSCSHRYQRGPPGITSEIGEFMICQPG
jgi:hypothetical protein